MGAVEAAGLAVLCFATLIDVLAPGAESRLASTTRDATAVKRHRTDAGTSRFSCDVKNCDGG